MSDMQLICGDCLEVMAGMEPGSVDTIITDPPYGLEFMGKDWDYGVPGVPYWSEALRVAKPGAHLLSFGGTRTHHRLMVAIEDSGWVIRDCMMWVYGSGFPKSHNISKQLDKMHGAERVASEWRDRYRDGNTRQEMGDSHHNHNVGLAPTAHTNMVTLPATPDAELWDGWGTALKPAYEPIIIAMKPLDGTFAQNALKHGVAGLWIDGARVEANYSDSERRSSAPGGGKGGMFIPNGSGHEGERHNGNGRWPANIIRDGSDEVMRLFPETEDGGNRNGKSGNSAWFTGHKDTGQEWMRDSGSAARFFYCAKASRRERDAGLGGVEARDTQSTGWSGDSMPLRQNGTERKMPQGRNHHPTVKPLALIEYLCNLTKTPSGGVVLDPFVGSGTTMVACVNTGRDGIGIDTSDEYIDIAQRRVAHAETQMQMRLPLEV